MTRDRRNGLFLSLIISAFIYASFLTLFVKVLAPKKMEDCIRCKQAIANYLNVQRAQQNGKADKYNESIYLFINKIGIYYYNSNIIFFIIFIHHLIFIILF